MENNEKNNKKRAPESMEDLISQLFFRDDDEKPEPPLTEKTTEKQADEVKAITDKPAIDAEPIILDDSSTQSTDIEEEKAESKCFVSCIETDTESVLADNDVMTANCDTSADEQASPSEVTSDCEEGILISPEITEADSAVMEGVRELEKINKEKNDKDETDSDEDNWNLIGTSVKNPFKNFFAFFIALYILFLAGLSSVFVWGVNQLIDVYDMSAPERVVDKYMDQLSGTTLFNDIAQRIKATKTEFETELSATENALKALSFEADKKYFLVSESDTSMLYDVFSGNTHLYSLALGKRSEAEVFRIKINFWEIRDVDFIDDCIASATKTYTVSAPADAEVRINGVKVSSTYVTNNDYRFFIGSVWETEVPDIARCVLYTVDGLYGVPHVTATLDGEELEVYVDEDGTSFHVKYPSKWVKNYTISVPSGASVHVNGVLATKIHSNGKGNDTIFDSGEKAKTDIYLIEGLFEMPTVKATFGTISLGEPTVDGESFTFGYIDEMYRTSYITVPKGSEVKVNGILLNADNSSSTSVPFTDLEGYAITLNHYMPAELRVTTNVKMPEFIRYTVVELYAEPEIEVTLNGISCKQFYEEHSERGGSHMYDFPVGISNDSVSSFAKNFAMQYVKYCTEGCYGVNDDIELRKNLYQNWVTYLSYVVTDSLCYDKALESYTDIRYRPIRKVVSEEYDVQNIMRYSDDIYFCRIVCTVARTGDEQPVISFINAIVVRINGEYKIWSHDEIPA